MHCACACILFFLPANIPADFISAARFVTAEIVGGQKPNSTIPWQVSVQKYNNHICGATILNGKTLLSAASCYHGTGYSIRGLSIRAGSLKLSSGGQVCNSVYVHINHFKLRASNFGLYIILHDSLPVQRKFYPS